MKGGADRGATLDGRRGTQRAEQTARGQAPIALWNFGIRPTVQNRETVLDILELGWYGNEKCMCVRTVGHQAAKAMRPFRRMNGIRGGEIESRVCGIPVGDKVLFWKRRQMAPAGPRPPSPDRLPRSLPRAFESLVACRCATAGHGVVGAAAHEPGRAATWRTSGPVPRVSARPSFASRPSTRRVASSCVWYGSASPSAASAPSLSGSQDFWPAPTNPPRLRRRR
jgi:hypothetical protein